MSRLNHNLSTARRISSFKRWGAICILLLAAWEILASTGAKHLVVKTESSQAEALVVLSGAADHVERAQWAASLFKQGRAPRIILTNDNVRGGWSQAEERNPLFVERALSELQGAGVPRERISVLPQTVDSTYAEATLLRQYAEANQVRSLLIVTSGYHSRRALWTFGRVFEGSQVKIALNAAPAGNHTPAPLTWWLSLTGWQVVAGEYLKLAWYHLRYS